VEKKSTSYTYDADGQQDTVTHPDQFSKYTYDLRELVKTVSVGKTATDANPKVTSYTYTDRGLKLQETKANDNTVDYTYYLDGPVRSTTEKKPGGTLVSSHTYAYDPNGNKSQDVAKKMNADDHGSYLSSTTDYTYDPADRLAKAVKTGNGADTEMYVHDDNANVISQTVDNTTTTYDYDRNRLLSTTSNGATANYTYDPFGRQESVTADGKVIERSVYDGFDHVVESQKMDDTGAMKSTTYTFDPFDRTASKSTAGKTTDFEYLGLSDEVLDEKVAGQLTKSYQYSPWGERLSQVKHNSDGTTEDGYYGYNSHTDVETLTDQNGDTKATYGYTAYGSDDTSEFTGIDKPDAADPTKEEYNAYRYNAKRWDAQSGTYDMGFRDYNPGLNRFTSRDVYTGALADMNLGADPYTGNRYAFTGGNPTSRIELDGHGWLDDAAGWVSDNAGTLVDAAAHTAEIIGGAGNITGGFSMIASGVGVCIGGGIETVGAACVVGAGAVIAGASRIAAGSALVVDGAVGLNNDITALRNSSGDDGGSGVSTRTPSGGEGGPGSWKHVNRGNSDGLWSRYEQQVTGVDNGYEYEVINPVTKRSVKFDGWDQKLKKLIEVKFGYSNGKWIDADGNPTKLLTEKFLEQGTRQTQAANGKAVEWVMSNEKAATAARKIFEENDLDITVRVEQMTNW
jgi:RHS repeat-associated protein